MDTTSSTNTNVTSPLANKKSNTDEVPVIEEEINKINNNAICSDEAPAIPSKTNLKKKTLKKKNQSKKEKEKEKKKSDNKNNELQDSKKSKDKKDASNIVIQSDEEEGSDIIIEIDEKNNLPKHVQEKKSIKKAKNKKSQKKKSQFLSGYNPFIFFEKEKFKEVNFKEVKQTEYVKQLAYLWRNMSDENKEPYVKMALDFKEKKLANQPKETKLINKKRKRNTTGDQEQDEFIEIKEEKSKEKCDEKKSSSVHLKSNLICGKRNKSEVKKGKIFGNNVYDEKYMEEYVYSVLVPFVDKSYQFLKNKGIINEE